MTEFTIVLGVAGPLEDISGNSDKSSGRKINCQFGEIEKDKDFEKSSNVGEKTEVQLL